MEFEEDELFSADSAEQMITDCLEGDESWKARIKILIKQNNKTSEYEALNVKT